MNSSVEPSAIWIGHCPMGSAMAPNTHIRAQYHLVRAPLPPRESQASSLGVWPIVFLLGTPNHTQNTLVLLWPTIHDTCLFYLWTTWHCKWGCTLHCTQTIHTAHKARHHICDLAILHTFQATLQLSTAGCVGIMRKTLWCTVKPVSPSDLVIENSLRSVTCCQPSRDNWRRYGCVQYSI